MSASLTFEPHAHVYRADGRIVPSVTTVLSSLHDFAGVPPEVLERAREFGVHVHRACELWNLNQLDLGSLDSNLLPYLTGWQSFLLESGFRVTHSEARVYHEKLGYAGTADVLGELHAATWVIDIKSGAIPSTVGPQLEAYRQAARPKPLRRGCVQLTGQGRYRFIECKDPADWSRFQSALSLYRFHHPKESVHA